MSGDRPDLGAMTHRLAREIARRERPLLEAYGLQMWDYAVLSVLENGSVPAQTKLASQVGRDTTRLIPTLDRLERRRLVRRVPDPQDRRNRVVSLTASGRSTLSRCRREIRAMEAELLAILPVRRGAAFVKDLQRLDDRRER